MRLKSKKLKRAKFDGAYIFATVFASIGGIILLSTYAASRPVQTFNPGSYNLSSFETSRSGEYKLGLNSKLTYCLSPVYSSYSTDISLKYRDNTQPITLTDSTADDVCFRTDKNYDEVTVIIQPIPDRNTLIDAR